jgi:WD40 repeat protein
MNNFSCEHRRLKRIAAAAQALIALVLTAAAPPVTTPAVDRHGDPLPPHAVSRLGTLRFRELIGISQAVAVRSGKQLLVSGLGTSVVLWDATTGKEVRRFEVRARRPARKEDGVDFHYVSIGSFAVSPDEKTLAVGTSDASGEDCPVFLFDIATGRKLAEWPDHRFAGYSGYPRLAFVTPTLLVTASHDISARVWDVTKNRELRRLMLPARSHVSAIVPSVDRKQVFIAGFGKEGFWTAWEVATGKLLHQERVPGSTVRLAFSPDGATLGLAMGMGGTEKEAGHTEMRLYSGPKWKERRRWRSHDGDDAGRCSITFSPDGKTIATGGADGKVRRWDAATLREIGPVIDPCQQCCQKVAYLDAATLMTFGFQETVKFWDAKTGKPKLDFGGAELQVTAIAYSPDGRHVAVGAGDSPIRLWDAASGKQVAALRDGMCYVTGLHFSPDGKWVLSGDTDGRARLWDWARGCPPIRTFCDHKASLNAVAFSPDGKSIATGHEDGIVQVWAVSSGKRLHTFKFKPIRATTTWVSSVAFSADGQSLFCGTLDGIRHLDLAAGKEVRVITIEALGHSNAVYSLVISPGGRWGYSASYDGSICVWETGSGRLARVIKKKEPGYNGTVRIALSYDGRRLAAVLTSDWDNPAVHLWDLTTAQKITGLKGHRAAVTQVAFSPDGRRLASGSCDTTALVWDISRLGAGANVPDAKAPAGLWKDLGDADPKAAYAAVCRGAAAGDAAVDRLKIDLKPAGVIDADRIAAWVRQLDSDTFAQREKASQALAHLGPAAEKPLRDLLAKANSAEVRRRLQRVLGEYEAEHRRLGFALEILEMIGTRAARRLLADLAKGASSSRLTHEARLALDRLEQRP